MFYLQLEFISRDHANLYLLVKLFFFLIWKKITKPPKEQQIVYLMGRHILIASAQQFPNISIHSNFSMIFFSNKIKDDNITPEPKKVLNSEKNAKKSLFWNFFVPNFSLGCQVVWLQYTFEVKVSILFPIYLSIDLSMLYTLSMLLFSP